MYLVKFGKDDEQPRKPKKEAKSKKSQVKDTVEQSSISLLAASLLLGVTGLSASTTQIKNDASRPNTIKIEQITLNRDENLEKLLRETENEEGEKGVFDYLRQGEQTPFRSRQNYLSNNLNTRSTFINRFRGLASPMSVNSIRLQPEYSLDEKLLAELKSKNTIEITVQRNRRIGQFEYMVRSASPIDNIDTVVAKLGGESLVMPNLNQEVLDRLDKIESSINKINDKTLLSDLLIVLRSILVAIIAGEIREKIKRRNKSNKENKIQFGVQDPVVRSPRIGPRLTSETESELKDFGTFRGPSELDSNFLVSPSQEIDQFTLDVRKVLRELSEKIDTLTKGIKKETIPTIDFWYEAGAEKLKNNLLLFYFHLYNLSFSPKSDLLNEKLLQEEWDRLIARFDRLII